MMATSPSVAADANAIENNGMDCRLGMGSAMGRLRARRAVLRQTPVASEPPRMTGCIDLIRIREPNQ